MGDVVLAIGDPFSVGQTVTMGIVSAVGREIGEANPFGSFIQTDAAINPGNSGGALVDINGNLIGINTLIFSRSGGYQGIGFAIPVSLAKRIMEQIIETGSVTRGWFGVDVANITPELAESLGLKSTRGAIVGAIERGSPAEKSGMKLGDVIVEIDGRPVRDVNTALNGIAGDAARQVGAGEGGAPRPGAHARRPGGPAQGAAPHGGVGATRAGPRRAGPACGAWR